MTSETARPSERTVSHNSVRTRALLSVIEWLAGDECHSMQEAGLLSGLGDRLRALGLPIDRITLHLTTLHPEFMGRSIAWAPDESVEVHDRKHGAIVATTNTPLRKVMETLQPLIVGPDESPDERWQHLDVFANRGLVQLIIAPLCNSGSPIGAVAFATKRPDGFTDVERRAIEGILPALRNASELHILRQVELNLLDTYVGPMTGRRILAGHIRRDEIESMEAALLLCDLRNFTELSNGLSNEAVFGLLNAYFETIIPAITGEGGEVLKFMGDAVLAFFPGEATKACASGLSAAKAILEEINHFRYQGISVRAGIALHYGLVSYGNIGSGRRLDFTLIGADVNLVSRIQTACGELGEPLLMSEAFMRQVKSPSAVSVGHHNLKGFSEARELFAVSKT